MTVPAVVCLGATLSHGGATSLGESASAAPSVRANAMGDAYTAASGDVFGAYYNPAHASPKAAGFNFTRGYAEDSTGVMALTLPDAAGGFNLGFSFLYYTAGKMDLYGPAGRIGEVNAQRDYMGLVNLSRSFGPLSVGANAKVLRTELFESNRGSAFLCDFGAQLKTPLVDLGAAVQNLGSRITIGSEAETIPRNIRLGAYRSFRLPVADLNAAVDLVKTDGEKTSAAAAGEFVVLKTLALRTGYEFRNALSGANNLRFGFGVSLSAFTLDYALVPYRDLGSTHRFALTYNFSK